MQACHVNDIWNSTTKSGVVNCGQRNKSTGWVVGEHQAADLEQSVYFLGQFLMIRYWVLMQEWYGCWFYKNFEKSTSKSYWVRAFTNEIVKLCRCNFWTINASFCSRDIDEFQYFCALMLCDYSAKRRSLWFTFVTHEKHFLLGLRIQSSSVTQETSAHTNMRKSCQNEKKKHNVTHDFEW